ncbi:MAG: diacylglycerol kinase family protein [Acidimicrobiia bacterium]
MSTVVLANPSSSGFTGAALRTVLAELGPDATAEWPESAAATAEVAASVPEGSTVVAMGGDGMVHHVVRGLRGRDVVLGIVPVGTTNVVARLLGIPRDPARAARVVADGEIRREPLGVARWTRADGFAEEAGALFSIGVGWDAEVVAAAEQEPYRKASGGVRLYARSTVVQLRREIGRLPDLTVATDPPSAADGRGIAVQAHLRYAYTFAGPPGIRLAPAEPGRLVVATWRRLRAAAVLPLLIAAGRAGGIVDHPDIGVGTVDGFTMTADHAVRLQVDGEPLGPITALEVRMDPAGLAVAAPRIEDA